MSAARSEASRALRQRLLTGLLLAPVALGLVAWLPPPLIWIVLAPLLVLSAWEWARLGGLVGQGGRVAYALAIGLLGVFLLPRLPPAVALGACAAGVVAWLLTAAWIGSAARAVPAHGGVWIWKLTAGAAALLVFYLALGRVFNGESGRGWLLVLLLVIWGADTGAYFAGRRFGRHKLAPRLSPGKTWEGVAGGLLVVALIAVLAGVLFGLPAATVGALVLVALVTASVSIVGDLFASVLKRHAGLKDSSGLLPGHGGFVDRLDSLLAAAPTFLVGLRWLGL